MAKSHDVELEVRETQIISLVYLSTPPSPSNTAKLQLTPRTTIVLVCTALIALALPNFTNMTSIFQRLTRPFTSSTMRFAPDQAAQTMNVPEGAQKATIAAGCFWGVEHMYRKDFGKKGLIDARVGYIGGDSKSPSYRAVCSGRTGRMPKPSLITIHLRTR